MDAIDSGSRVTAQLSRLLGLVAAQLDQHLSEAALRAVAALCDFNAGSVPRAECLRAAATVAAGSDQVANTVKTAATCAMMDFDEPAPVNCALEMSLTLLEGASVQGRSPPEGQLGIIYVTGQHGWLHKDRWVLEVACIVGLRFGQSATYDLSQSPGNVRRMVAWAAATGCAH